MEEQKRLVDELRRVLADVQKIASELKVSVGEALFLLSHREIVILNDQLRGMHGTLGIINAKIDRIVGVGEEKDPKEEK